MNSQHSNTNFKGFLCTQKLVLNVVFNEFNLYVFEVKNYPHTQIFNIVSINALTKI